MTSSGPRCTVVTVFAPQENNMSRSFTRRLSLSGAVAAAVASVTVALPAIVSAAGFTPWGAAVPVTQVNQPAPVNDGCPIEAPDGKHLYIASNRAGTFGGNDLWVATRANERDPWGDPQNLGPVVNSGANDYCPTPLAGNWLLFVSERPVSAPCSTATGSGDLFITGKSPVSGWLPPQHLGCVAAGSGPNSSGPEYSPSLIKTEQGTFLYFSSNGGGTGPQDIYVSKLGDDGLFSLPTVVAELSTLADDRMPNLSRDGLEIVFSSNRTSWGGGQLPAGGQDVYTAHRSSVTGAWSDPVNVAGANTTGNETRASMSRDRTRLYFGRDGDVYMSTRQRLPDHDDQDSGHGRDGDHDDGKARY
jgi:hypothetical protein